MKPTACESSTMTSALYLSAKSQISRSFAIWPSMEKTPSVAIMRIRAPDACLSCSSRSFMSPLRSKSLRLRKPYAVNDAGVVQLIGNHSVLLLEQCLKQPAIGVKTGTVEDRVLCPEKLADPPL